MDASSVLPARSRGGFSAIDPVASSADDLLELAVVHETISQIEAVLQRNVTASERAWLVRVWSELDGEQSHWPQWIHQSIGV